MSILSRPPRVLVAAVQTLAPYDWGSRPLYNGGAVQGTIPLTAGGSIQIGETEIVFDDGTYNSSMGATMITDNSSTSLPEATIALASGDRAAIRQHGGPGCPRVVRSDPHRQAWWRRD